MTVGPGSLVYLTPGFELRIASADIKHAGHKGVVVMHCAEDSSVAGMFALNVF